MEDVRYAVEVLANLLYLIEIDRAEPDRVALYISMAQPALEELQRSLGPLPSGGALKGDPSQQS